MLNELGKQAYSALRHNRRRSLLTMLGMAWGIATVVLLLAYGSGFERGLMIAFETFGGNFIAIFPGRTSLQAGGSKAGTEVKLSVQDLDYLRTEVPFIKPTPPMPSVSRPIKPSRTLMPMVMICNSPKSAMVSKTNTARMSLGLKLWW